MIDSSTYANYFIRGNGADVHVRGNLSVGTALDMTSGKITNLATPTASTDAATKGYVDTAVASAGLPSGMVAIFLSSECPTGWTRKSYLCGHAYSYYVLSQRSGYQERGAVNNFLTSVCTFSYCMKD